MPAAWPRSTGRGPEAPLQGAVKGSRPEIAAVVGAERFLKQIEVPTNLDHPHILPLFDSGEALGSDESRPTPV